MLFLGKKYLDYSYEAAKNETLIIKRGRVCINVRLWTLIVSGRNHICV